MTLVIWRCSKPNAKKKPGLREIYEKIAAKSAKKIGRTIAEIRSPSHPTTKKNDQWVKIQSHLTMLWFYKSSNSNSSSEGVASIRSAKQGHVFVDSDNPTRMLSSSEINQISKDVDSNADNVGQNPHKFPYTLAESEKNRLTFKANQGTANIDCSTL